MLSLVYSYWQFLLRESKVDVIEDGSAVPSYIGGYIRDTWFQDFIFYLLSYIALTLSAPFILRKLSKSYRELDLRTQKMCAVHIAAVMHHLYVTPFSISLIMDDFQKGSVDPARTVSFHPFSTAYLVSDIIFASIPDALDGKYLMLFHHLLGLGLSGASYFATTQVARWVPHFLICEASSIPFVFMWYYRKTKQENTKQYVFVALSFLISFTIVRIFNLPLVVSALYVAHKDILDSMGYFSWFFIPVVLLQFYWWVQIISGCSRAVFKKSVSPKKLE